MTMRIHKTSFGDTWDSIAKLYYGDEFVMDKLLALQKEETLRYFILPAGIEIILPDESADESMIKYFRAPWNE